MGMDGGRRRMVVGDGRMVLETYGGRRGTVGGEGLSRKEETDLIKMKLLFDYVVEFT